MRQFDKRVELGRQNREKFVHEGRDRILTVYDRQNGYKKSTDVSKFDIRKNLTDALEFNRRKNSTDAIVLRNLQAR